MEFTVEFYETNDGRCPVRDFLDELKASDPNDFATVMAGLAKLRNRQYHREPLSKPLGDGLFELRHVGKLNTRIIWFYVKGRGIIAVHGIRNKGQAVPARDLDTARQQYNMRGRRWMDCIGRVVTRPSEREIASQMHDWLERKAL
jgi:phage-related protein